TPTLRRVTTESIAAVVMTVESVNLGAAETDFACDSTLKVEAPRELVTGAAETTVVETEVAETVADCEEGPLFSLLQRIHPGYIILLIDISSQ
nr:hypothetical protein [Tanacetum cinerariifolium]